MLSGRFSKVIWSDDFLVTDEGNDTITVAIGGSIAFSVAAHDRIHALERHVTTEAGGVTKRLTVLEAELAAATARIAELEARIAERGLVRAA